MQTEIGSDITKAVKWLRNNHLVAIPTETVYGLAGNALVDDVVLQIFKLKARPAFDPLIVHIGNKFQLTQFVTEIPDIANQLIEKFWPGPLTILLNRKPVISDLVTSGLQTVAVRMPSHPLTLELLNQLDFPLAAPSANPFGYISPTSAQHVASHFQGKIPYILDGGNCNIGIESTIVGFHNNQCCVYRHGGISLSTLEKVTGKVNIEFNASENPSAPGMLKSHYAPVKPLWFGTQEELMSQMDNVDEIVVLCFNKEGLNIPQGITVVELSPEASMDEAARNLFSVMRELDQSDYKKILAFKLPELGLGLAINDRLRRASVNN